MAILRVRDSEGNISEIPAIVGPPGKDYQLTQDDKTEIADIVKTEYFSEIETMIDESGVLDGE